MSPSDRRSVASAGHLKRRGDGRVDDILDLGLRVAAGAVYGVDDAGEMFVRSGDEREVVDGLLIERVLMGVAFDSPVGGRGGMRGRRDY